MKLFHITTPKKAKLYRETGAIRKPVRGFTTEKAAMAWSLKIDGTRNVLISFEAYAPHKLPDHHNRYGEAWWNDGDISEYKVIRG